MSLRHVLTATILVVLCLPQAALARETGPTWESETSGAPVSTMQGHWTETNDGRSVELVFVGGHLIAAGTTFRATWLTPFTTKGERPKFDHSYDFENHNELGKNIDLVQSFRFRSKGGKWSPWITSKDTLKPGSTFMGGVSAFGGGWKRPAQFEWRLTGAIEAPTYLRGSASFSIN